MKKSAMLLIGPTGSGKTPLGNYIESHGLWNQRLAHFDFGELLRKTVAQNWSCGLSASELNQLSQILQDGALLEADTFYLAETIIRHFNQTTSADQILLNGLPRHLGQAEDIAPFFNVNTVVVLECTPEVVLERIQSNSGRDRTLRTDDNLALIQKKLITFSERTTSLIDYYHNKGAQILNVPVEIDTQPQFIVQHLEQINTMNR